MDRIHISDLLVRCILGVTEEERRERQDVLVSLTLQTDLRPAGLSDRLADAVDYRALKKRVLAAAEASSHHLAEALAESIAALCLDDPRIVEVDVTVEKPGALRFARSVAVEVHRRRG